MMNGDGGMGGWRRASQVLNLTTHDKERLGKAKLGRWVRNYTKPITANGRGWGQAETDRLKPDLLRSEDREDGEDKLN